MDTLKDIFMVLWPTLAANEDRQTFIWRVLVALTLYTGIVMMTLQSLIIWGFLPVFGFSGFAGEAATVADKMRLEMRFNQLAQGQKDTQMILVSQNLFNLKIMQCNAIRAKNPALATQVGQQIVDKKLEFFSVSSGRLWAEPSCLDLGIVP